VKDNADAATRLGTTGSVGPYGPSTGRVRRFLQRVAELDAASWTAAVADHVVIASSPAGRSADRALGRAIEAAGLHGERDAVLGPVVQLAATQDRRANIATDAGAETLLAAALAIVATPPLEHAALATLYAPFARLIPLASLDQ
jgi:hypothetical protein